MESAESYKDAIIDQRHLVPGDILYVDPGDTIPVEYVVVESFDLSIDQSRSLR